MPRHPTPLPAPPHTPPPVRAVRARLAASITLSALSIAASLCLVAVQIYGPRTEFVETSAAVVRLPLTYVIATGWAFVPIIALCLLSSLPRRREFHGLPVTLGITAIALELIWMLMLTFSLILYALSTDSASFG